jgi:hypothetical protein
MTTRINTQYLYFDNQFEPHKQYIKKYVKPMRRKVSEKLSKSAYTKFFEPDSLKSINRWLKERSDESRRQKFHQIFKVLASYKPDSEGKFVTNIVYDSNFNTASVCYTIYFCHILDILSRHSQR